MSASQPASDADQEMDLTDIFTLFQRIFYKFLALCFKALDFIFKSWWVILLLIILGATLGYFTKGEPKYTSDIIIKTNYKSQSYVYNAIKQFDDNLSEKDEEFIKSVGLDINNLTIKGVKISPIIDVVALIGGEVKISDRALSTVIKELDVNEDTELFASDRFYSNYEFHKITVTLSGESAKKDIDKIITFINNQPYIQKISKEFVQNIEDHIAKNEIVLQQADSMMKIYASSSDVSQEIKSKDLSFFNNQNNLNVNGVLVFKNTVLKEIQELKDELVTSSSAIIVMSDIQVSLKESLKDRKEIIYPILFVFFFLILAGIRYTYISLRKIVEAQNLLD
ncbi:hypothetical protein [uncultured Dokdonia sp.]|uniref:hypothetical protein n=1 Tax=uncultured Dokdonia sp. TaxID=575653 RepID=UPI0026367325|nr:hypothetical protein [uncultured Dokdonia sp.]